VIPAGYPLAKMGEEKGKIKRRSCVLKNIIRVLCIIK
jgi:hypothetical protein